MGDGGPPRVVLRPGRADEAVSLSELAFRSKAYRGYDEEFMAACRAELTLDGGDAETCVVACMGEELVGFYRLEEDRELAAGDGRLGMLFVEPSLVGTGIGRVMWRDAVVNARARGWLRLVLDADPAAHGFYVAMGAAQVGEAPSGSVPGRLLPVFALTLT